MSFSELGFIFFILPVFVLLLRSVRPKLIRSPLIMLGSTALYLAGLALDGPVSIAAAVIFLSVMLFTWASAHIIESSRSGRKTTLTVSVMLLVGLLALYKYVIPPVPPGMSFYIFTAIAYLSDVSRRQQPAGSFADFGAYFTLFPKLLSGPIARWGDVREQLDGSGCTTEALADGIRLFITGLAEKVLLADTIGRLWRDICAVGIESISTPLAWLGAAAFSVQLYLDFQGYSTMARGVGKMIGVELPVNFDYPYLSRSVSEFWRRWHITLGTWFRDYVYIPLGGSRKGRAALVFNLLIVWLLTGIWHGATVNFLLWGFALFVFIAAEKLIFKGFLERHKIISHIYVLIVMPLTWMLFANTDAVSLAVYFERLFSFSGGIVGLSRYVGSYGLSLAAGTLCCTPLPARLFEKINKTIVGTVIYAALLAGSVYMIWLSGSGPFMYFSF